MNSERTNFLQPSDFWTWRGKVSRAKYAGLGIFLFAIKHVIDRIVAAFFGYQWTFLDYWVYTERGIESVTNARAEFYAVLILVALPFIWIGLVLTLRRLRDSELPLWWVAFFFLPFVNLLFFLLLSIIPSARPKSSGGKPEGDSFKGLLSRIIPSSEIGSAAMGILLTVILAVLLTMLSVYALTQYGWGLFVGIPFFLGLNSVLIYGYHGPRGMAKCLLVSLLSVLFVGATLFIIAFEGLICLLMAAPLAVPLAALGGFVGFLLQRRYTFASESLHVFSLLVFVLPGLITMERLSDFRPPRYSVRTSVIINAPPEKVWKNLIAFAELPPPSENLFKTGIAYPTRARIEGNGVGAVRHCIFSTGEFVEPIRVWDQPKLLKFDVASQPRVMDEWSLYHGLHPPHLENYFVSREGQFLLEPLSNGRTLLAGTTWYENRFWPGQYWRLWSDFIIHRIHARVLVHIKNLSELEHANEFH